MTSRFRGIMKGAVSVALAVALAVTPAPRMARTQASTASAATTIINMATGSKVSVIKGEYTKDAFVFNVSDKDVTINVKTTSSKKIIVKKTYTLNIKAQSFITYNYGVYTKATGRFKVTFTAVKDGKVLESRNVTVFSRATPPIKKITFAGKVISNQPHKLGTKGVVTNLTKGKLKVTMTSGYYVQAVRVGRNDKSTGAVKYTTYDNGDTFKLGTVVDPGTSQNDENIKITTSSAVSTTEIIIRYRDKNLGVTSEETFYICRIAG